MATLQSRSWISLQNNGETSSSCHPTPNLFGYGLQKDTGRRGLKLWRNFGEKELPAKGCRCGGRSRSGISEDDRRFLEVVREVEPHILLQRGSTFVVVVSGELANSPHLDELLKVSLSRVNFPI